MMTPVSQACSMGCIVREPIQESDEYEVFSFFNWLFHLFVPQDFSSIVIKLPVAHCHPVASVSFVCVCLCVHIGTS